MKRRRANPRRSSRQLSRRPRQPSAASRDPLPSGDDVGSGGDPPRRQGRGRHRWWGWHRPWHRHRHVDLRCRGCCVGARCRHLRLRSRRGRRPVRPDRRARRRAGRSRSRATTVDRFGRIDVLVNNAGGVFASPLLDTSENGFDALHRANLRHVLLCTQRVARVMVDAGRAARSSTSRPAKGCVPHRAMPPTPPPKPVSSA